MSPEVVPWFHAATGTYSYLVCDPETRVAAIVDPVLDFDVRSARRSTLFADALIAHAHEKKLKVEWILETHAHADHLSAGAYLREELGAKLAIGAGIVGVQKYFAPLFGFEADFAADGSQFDTLFHDGDAFALGGIAARVLATPGHTGDGVCYVIGDAAFVGDTMFAPDVGTARCDFPGGDARTLYRSIARILALPQETRLFLAHDYPPQGRAPKAETTIAAQRGGNAHLAKSEDEYVAMREERDATLAVPNLLLPAVQYNIRGGRPPPPDANGTAYLKLPLDVV